MVHDVARVCRLLVWPLFGPWFLGGWLSAACPSPLLPSGPSCSFGVALVLLRPLSGSWVSTWSRVCRLWPRVSWARVCSRLFRRRVCGPVVPSCFVRALKSCVGGDADQQSCAWHSDGLLGHSSHDGFMFDLVKEASVLPDSLADRVVLLLSVPAVCVALPCFLFCRCLSPVASK